MMADPRASLGKIVRAWKGDARRHIRKACLTFAWQSRFYDHLIRDDVELSRTRRYIRNNYVIASGPFTGGTLSAQVVDGMTVERAYPDSLSKVV